MHHDSWHVMFALAMSPILLHQFACAYIASEENRAFAAMRFGFFTAYTLALVVWVANAA